MSYSQENQHQSATSGQKDITAQSPQPESGYYPDEDRQQIRRSEVAMQRVSDSPEEATEEA